MKNKWWSSRKIEDFWLHIDIYAILIDFQLVDYNNYYDYLYYTWTHTKFELKMLTFQKTNIPTLLHKMVITPLVINIYCFMKLALLDSAHIELSIHA